ncbi:MAG: hypothetical protein ACQESO_07945, partial [Bacillota bacterium]
TLFTRTGRLIEVSVDSTYINSPRLLACYCISGQLVETSADSAIINSPRLLTYYCISGRLLESAAEGLIVGSLTPLRKFSYQVSSLEKGGPLFGRLLMFTSLALQLMHATWLKYIDALLSRTKKIFISVFYFLFSLDYTYKGKFFQMVNTANFEYYLLVFFILLIVIMALQLL